MAHTDPRIDAYIARSAPFARPILTHLRTLVHRACKDVRETTRWGFPHFDHHGLLCAMAAFRQHCTFGFWKASLMSDPNRLFASRKSMGNIGRITSRKDLPADTVLLRYLREAVKLNEQGIRVIRKRKPARPLRIPADLAAAIRKNARASKAFASFSPSQKRDYAEWISEAKTAETRTRRLTTAVTWIAQGKVRNWKYLQRR